MFNDYIIYLIFFPRSLMEATESELLIKSLMISSYVSSLKYCDFPSMRRGRERSDSGLNSSHQGLLKPM